MSPLRIATPTLQTATLKRSHGTECVDKHELLAVFEQQRGYVTQQPKPQDNGDASNRTKAKHGHGRDAVIGRGAHYRLETKVVMIGTTP